MKDQLPHDHDVFAAALPELRQHFETAAERAGHYDFVYRSIADDLSRAENSVAANGVANSAQAINSARNTLIAISEEPDFGALGHDLAAALHITQSHQKKAKGFGF